MYDQAAMVGRTQITRCACDALVLQPVKLMAVLDNINKQYKVPQLTLTHLPCPGQSSTSSIHRHYSTHWGFAQWAVPRSWVSALTVGYHTSLCVQSPQNSERSVKCRANNTKVKQLLPKPLAGARSQQCWLVVSRCYQTGMQWRPWRTDDMRVTSRGVIVCGWRQHWTIFSSCGIITIVRVFIATTLHSASIHIEKNLSLH